MKMLSNSSVIAFTDQYGMCSNHEYQCRLRKFKRTYQCACENKYQPKKTPAPVPPKPNPLPFDKSGAKGDSPSEEMPVREPEEPTPEDTGFEDPSPGESTPEDTAPEETSTEDTDTETTSPEDTTTEDSSPENSANEPPENQSEEGSETSDGESESVEQKRSLWWSCCQTKIIRWGL